jgi:hypothetical protein
MKLAYFYSCSRCLVSAALIVSGATTALGVGDAPSALAQTQAAQSSHSVAAVLEPPAPGADAAPAIVQIDYELRYNPAPEALQWEAHIRATGLDPTQRGVALELDSWSGWLDVDALYLRALRSDPPIRPQPEAPTRFIVDAPTDWDGSLSVSYAVPLIRRGSRVYSNHLLLPWQTDAYACGFSVSALMRVLCNGQSINARRTVTLTAPPGATIATGWGGVSMEKQVIELSHDIDNGLILFGDSPYVARAEAEGIEFEVVQFPQGTDATPAILHLAHTLIPACGRTTGKPIDKPVRIFITHGGGGGTRTDHGVVVGFNVEAVDLERSLDFKLLIAHELFHEWLGGYLHPTPDDESLIWFYEGFTDYLALWHLTHSGLVSMDGFAHRLAELDSLARNSSAYGRVAFADSSARWRDDGPNERLAYRGGGLLAFFLDLELRKQGRPGLPEMLADLIRETDGKYSQESLRAWMEAHGQGEFYVKYIQSPALFPNLHETLTALGYEAETDEVELTYLGIRTDADTQRGQVTAIDPDGPAAQTGLKVGDRIRGFFPARGLQPLIRETVDTTYRFGLNLIEPGDPGTFIDALRGKEEITIKIQPRAIPGGYTTHYRADASRLKAFFDYQQ